MYNTKNEAKRLRTTNFAIAKMEERLLKGGEDKEKYSITIAMLKNEH